MGCNARPPEATPRLAEALAEASEGPPGMPIQLVDPLWKPLEDRFWPNRPLHAIQLFLKRSHPLFHHLAGHLEVKQEPIDILTD